MKKYIKLSIIVFTITFATFGTFFISNAKEDKSSGNCRCVGTGGFCMITPSQQTVTGSCVSE